MIDSQLQDLARYEGHGASNAGRAESGSDLWGHWTGDESTNLVGQSMLWRVETHGVWWRELIWKREIKEGIWRNKGIGRRRSRGRNFAFLVFLTFLVRKGADLEIFAFLYSYMEFPVSKLACVRGPSLWPWSVVEFLFTMYFQRWHKIATCLFLSVIYWPDKCGLSSQIQFFFEKIMNVLLPINISFLCWGMVHAFYQKKSTRSHFPANGQGCGVVVPTRL